MNACDLTKTPNNTRHKITIHKDYRFEIRTRPSIWLNSPESIILPFSIHSDIYEGQKGEYKIRAFLKIINDLAGTRKKTILLCEGSHLNVLSLNFNNDLNKAFSVCVQDSKKLLVRFQNDFSDYHIAFWDKMIFQDNDYASIKAELFQLYSDDKKFKALLIKDAEISYTDKFAAQYPNKEIFLARQILDYLEMMISLRIMYKTGHHILVYPGVIPSSMQYAQSLYNPNMIFVNVGIKGISK